jgi:hypothetical protein
VAGEAWPSVPWLVPSCDVRVLEAEEGQAITMKPYGAMNSEGRFESWIKLFKMHYEPKGYCIHWLKHISCPKGWCSSSGGWADHVSGYTNAKGERILLAQPYALGVEDMESLVKVARENNLYVTVHGGGWYGHGTVCVELKEKR